jgi:hypothetical protein
MHLIFHNVYQPEALSSLFLHLLPLQMKIHAELGDQSVVSTVRASLRETLSDVFVTLGEYAQ